MLPDINAKVLHDFFNAVCETRSSKGQTVLRNVCAEMSRYGALSISCGSRKLPYKACYHTIAFWLRIYYFESYFFQGLWNVSMAYPACPLWPLCPLSSYIVSTTRSILVFYGASHWSLLCSLVIAAVLDYWEYRKSPNTCIFLQF